jgi:hypothetical protein
LIIVSETTNPSGFWWNSLRWVSQEHFEKGLGLTFTPKAKFELPIPVFQQPKAATLSRRFKEDRL